jgi:hypothetical protein
MDFLFDNSCGGPAGERLFNQVRRPVQAVVGPNARLELAGRSL